MDAYTHMDTQAQWKTDRHTDEEHAGCVSRLEDLTHVGGKDNALYGLLGLLAHQGCVELNPHVFLSPLLGPEYLSTEVLSTWSQMRVWRHIVFSVWEEFRACERRLTPEKGWFSCSCPSGHLGTFPSDRQRKRRKRNGRFFSGTLSQRKERERKRESKEDSRSDLLHPTCQCWEQLTAWWSGLDSYGNRTESVQAQSQTQAGFM